MPVGPSSRIRDSRTVRMTRHGRSWKLSPMKRMADGRRPPIIKDEWFAPSLPWPAQP
jgi:hypothetical protein